MKINGLTAYDYQSSGNDLALILGCGVNDALAMDTSIIEVKTDQGSVVETFAGYVKRSATVDAATGRVTLLCYLDKDGTGAAVDALAKELAASKAQNASLQAQISEQAAAIKELAALIKGEQA